MTIPPIVVNLGLAALRYVAFAAFFYGLGYFHAHLGDQPSTGLETAEVRIQDGIQVQNSLDANRQTSEQLTQAQDAVVEVIATLPTIEIIAPRHEPRITPSEPPTASFVRRNGDGDPHLSMDVVRLLNAARTGTAADAAAIGDAARRAAAAATD